MNRIGDKVVVLLPSGHTTTGVITTRHPDGSASVRVGAVTYRVASIVVFKVQEAA